MDRPVSPPPHSTRAWLPLALASVAAATTGRLRRTVSAWRATGPSTSVGGLSSALPRRWTPRAVGALRPQALRSRQAQRAPAAAGPAAADRAAAAPREWAWTEFMPTSVWVVDVDSHVLLACNRAARRAFGLWRHRVLGQDLSVALRAHLDPGLLRQVVASRGDAVFEGGGRWRGRHGFLRLHQRVARAADGRAVRIISAIDTVGEQDTRQQLADAQQQLRELGRSIDDCLFVSDPDRTRIEFLNHRAEAVLGLSQAELGADPWRPLQWVVAEDKPLLDARADLEREHLPTEITYRIRHPELGLRTVRSRTRTALGRDGQARVYGSLSDLTAQQDREEALRRALSTAEAASQAKSQFMANMSHEIRTPMNGILGMTELLLGTGLSDRQRRFAQAVYRSGESLLEIINDILDFSKIEAGKLELAPCDFLLRGVVEDTLELLAPRAHEKGLELSFREAAGLPLMVHGDPLRLRQVLTNLVANAIKFTHVGEVVVDLQCLTPADGGEVLLEFAVRDTGIGIESHVLPRLFSAFTQANGGMSKRYGGTGLGLAISRQLIELMGGGIRVSSAPGVGSAFVFTVRLRGADQPCAGAPADSEFNSLHGPLDLPTLRVLVVDDHPTNRGILEQMLGDWGMDVVTACDGRQALALLHPEDSTAPPRFDLALVDMHMPHLDGLGLAHAVRAAGLHPALRMILLSSVSAPDDVLASQRAGFHRFVAKPIRRAELRQAIVAVCINKESAQDPQTDGLRLEGDVLVVEDNTVNQEVISHMLRRVGLRVTVASSALHGLRKLGEAHFDLVLMDIQMPGMDGVEALSWFRRGSGSRFSFVTPTDTPVIAVTANALGGDEERFRSLGFDDYLSKPFRQSQLLAMLTQRLRPQAPADGQMPEPGAAPVRQDGLIGGVLDAAAIERLRELDPDGRNHLLHRVAQAFETSANRLLPQLEEAERAQDLNAVRHVAHTLKSSSASLGAMALSQLCAELEGQVRQARVVDLPQQVDRISHETGVVLQALKLLMDPAP